MFMPDIFAGIPRAAQPSAHSSSQSGLHSTIAGSSIEVTARDKILLFGNASFRCVFRIESTFNSVEILLS